MTGFWVGCEFQNGRVKIMRMRRRGARWTRLHAQEAQAEEGPLTHLLAGIPERRGLLRKTAFVLVPRSEIVMERFMFSGEESAEGLISRVFPFPLQEWEWTYQPIRSKENKSGILFIAMPKERVDFYRQRIESSKFRFGGIAPSCAARWFGVKREFPNARPLLPTGLLYREDGQTEFCVYLNDAPVFYRKVETSGSDYAAFAKSLRQLRDEFNSESAFAPMGRLILAGVKAVPEDLKSLLDDQPPIDIVSYSTEFPSDLAMKGAFENLPEEQVFSVQGAARPPGFWLAAAPSSFRRPVVMAGALLSLFLFIGFVFTKPSVQKPDAPLASSARVSPSGLLALTIERLPDGVRLSEFLFDLEKGRVDIKAQSGNYELVAETVKRLSEINGLSGVQADRSRLLNKGNQSAVEFSIQAVTPRPALSSSRRDSSLPVGWHRFLEDQARKNRISKLISMEQRAQRSSPELEIQWESDLISSLKFLTGLESAGVVGACVQTRISRVENAPTQLNVNSVFSLNRSTEAVMAALPMPAARYQQVFFPLWRSAPVNSAERKHKKVLEREARLRDQERLERERREKAEETQREAKRRQLEAGLSVTGIVNNGEQTLAFVSIGGGSSKTLILKTGDTVQEARVADIDEARGLVVLDLGDGSEATLRLGAAGGLGNP